MTYTPPSTYVVGYLGGMRFFARQEYYRDLVQSMKDKTCVEFIDVDGEHGTVNGIMIESVFLSSPDSRRDRDIFEETLKSDSDKEPWK